MVTVFHDGVDGVEPISRFLQRCFGWRRGGDAMKHERLVEIKV